MTQRKRDTRAILRTIAQSEQRSSLFRWMVEHHDELVEASSQDRIHWASFCAEASKRGLTDTQGKAPTMATARKTWTRARNAVREARAQLAARPPKPVYPSRMPKWTPPAILAAIEAGNPAVEGVGRPATLSEANALVPSPERGVSLRAVPPPPIPPPKPASDRPISQYADPDDPPEIHEAYASLEEQFQKADWYLMAGKPKKRRTE